MLRTLRKLRYLLTRRDRVLAGGLFALMLLASLLEIVGVGSIPAFVAVLGEPDRLLRYDPVRNLTTGLGLDSHQDLIIAFAAGMAVLFILKNGYLAVLRYLEARYTFRRGVSIGSRLFDAYLHSPYTFHLQRNTARVLSNTSTLSRRVIESVLLPFVSLARESLVLIGLFLLLVFAEPMVSLVAFGTLGLMSGGFYLLLQRRLSEHGVRSQEHQQRLIQAVTEGLGGIKMTKLRGRESYFSRRYRDSAHGYADADIFRAVSADLPRLSIETTAVLALLVVSLLFVAQGRSLASILPVLTLFAAASVRLVPSFNRISMALSQIRFGQSAVDIVHAELEAMEGRAERDTVGGVGSPSLQTSIEIRDLSYRYPGADSDALKGVSAEIQAGSAVAFVGPSGAGKTTAVNVLLGLLEPSAGGVYVDGVDIRTMLRSWQRRIGYIPQDVYLIDSTIRRNIGFGMEESEIDEGAVWRAVRAAQLESLVQQLPDGLDTRVGEHGIRLSGGQRQRVSIARALHHDPDVLVLDEATSDLDNETERYIMAAIDRLRGDRTVVVIAHRLSTVQGCDRLFFLDQGRLAAQGTYDELLEKSERFRAMAGI